MKRINWPFVLIMSPIVGYALGMIIVAIATIMGLLKGDNMNVREYIYTTILEECGKISQLAASSMKSHHICQSMNLTESIEKEATELLTHVLWLQTAVKLLQDYEYLPPYQNGQEERVMQAIRRDIRWNIHNYLWNEEHVYNKDSDRIGPQKFLPGDLEEIKLLMDCGRNETYDRT